jgi:hypothetical protein
VAREHEPLDADLPEVRPDCAQVRRDQLARRRVRAGLRAEPAQPVEVDEGVGLAALLEQLAERDGDARLARADGAGEEDRPRDRPILRCCSSAAVEYGSPVPKPISRLPPLLGLWLALAAVFGAVAAQVTDWFDMTDELRYEQLALSIARSGSPLLVGGAWLLANWCVRPRLARRARSRHWARSSSLRFPSR